MNERMYRSLIGCNFFRRERKKNFYYMKTSLIKRNFKKITNKIHREDFNRLLIQKYNPKENNNFVPYLLHISMVDDLVFSHENLMVEKHWK